MKMFNNKEYWNNHYLKGGNSGRGSRGVFKEIKKSIIKYFLKNFDCKSVVDFGCGDLEVVKELDIKEYTGYDLSGEIIKINSVDFPDWNFIVSDLRTFTKVKADLVLCFDVLIHQEKRENFEAILKNCLAAFKKVLIISVAKTNIETNWMFFYNNPYNLIKKFAPGALIHKICVFRDTEIVAVIKEGIEE